MYDADDNHIAALSASQLFLPQIILADTFTSA